ncbi:hypothetical protein [Methanococcus sp. CF]
MVSNNVMKTIEEIESQISQDTRYIELVTTVEYLISLVSEDKKEVFRKALNDAENVEDVKEVLNAIKLQIGSQGAKKYLGI